MTPLKHFAPPQPIDDFSAWLDAFTQTSVVAELMVLVLSALFAWASVAAIRRTLGAIDRRSIWFGRSVVDGVLFPLLLLCWAFVGLQLLGYFVHLAIFSLVIPALVALLAIRVGVKVLQATFARSPWIKLLEQTISWVAWIAMVLWVSGLLPLVLSELDQVTWKVGSSTLSVRTMIEGTLTAGAVLILALWVSAGIEARLLRSATGGELSLRKAVSNAVRAMLMFFGLLVALSAVGIDLTALSVLGGAVGVGVGFGLQKLAANYVSGFVILTERSMRIGDFIRVDGFEGHITQINARYTVVRSQNGRESIVPNEMLIVQRVENLSLADPKVSQSVSVTVDYGSDVTLVMHLLAEVVRSHPRVLREPASSVQLANFATEGLEFTVVYWIADLENGQGNLRSELNVGILQNLRAHGVAISAPQKAVLAAVR
ncbi:MAG: mechanosensitive ion channel [Rhodoferax sp.]|nr:mechanosensitive ion channel [Rhodoferax sp.]